MKPQIMWTGARVNPHKWNHMYNSVVGSKKTAKEHNGGKKHKKHKEHNGGKKHKEHNDWPS